MSVDLKATDASVPFDPVTWLAEVGRWIAEPGALLAELSRRLDATGIGLMRSSCFVRTLHPQVRGRTLIWRRADDEIEEFIVMRGIEKSEAFLKSPLPAIFEGAAAIRRRLDIPDARLDFPILEELKEAGATDYVALPLTFTDGQINFLTWVSDRPGGFPPSALGELYRLLPTLSLLMEVHARRALTRSLMELYLGAEAGGRVLAGEIDRGSGQTIEAVVLFSDLRGFTALSDRLPREALIPLLNAYFERVVGPVEKQGGEILKFVGDGVLAIFPVADRPHEAAQRALAAAREAAGRLTAYNEERTAAGERPIGFGIALHVGAVTYGNIGAPRRLDFTIIGPAVNLASRIEGLTKRLDRAVLISADVAALAPEGLESLGWQPVRGLARPIEVFGLVGAGAA